MCTGEGANSGEPIATGVHTREWKFWRTNWAKQSLGELNGEGRVCGSRARARGVRAERKPCPPSGLEGAPASSSSRGVRQKVGG
jgi:hypothetical protein